MRNALDSDIQKSDTISSGWSEQSCHSLIELCPDALMIHDGETVVLANHAMARLVGAQSSEELVSQPILDFVAPSSHALVQERILRIHQVTAMPPTHETWRRRDGREVEVEVAAKHVPWVAPQAAMVVARDVTERKRLDTERERLLAEKELLMREVHHRVANSLQLVQGLLKIQARGAANDAARSQLWEASARIGTIGSLHARLQKEGSVVEGDVRAYLEGMIADLRIALGETSERQILLDTCHVETLILRADLLSALGLIVAEAVTNSIKHGAGHIRISLMEQDACLELAVEDDGAGFPVGFDPHIESTGLGMRMITSLVQAHGGSITIGGEGKEGELSPSRIATTIPL